MADSRRSPLAPTLALGALLLAAGAASPALAWEDLGHRWIGMLAMQSLPSDLPAFLRVPELARDVGEWAREPDRSRGSGRTHDSDRDPGHFADVDDDGKLLGGPPLDRLPATRAEYEKQLQAAGTDSWKAGYLSYNIVEGWQQLVKDFAYWRADAYGEKTTRNPANKAWLAADRIRRERQLEFDLGYWAHFVGDGSQPLHVTYHYNGWGNFPNPKGFTQEHIHGPFEGDFVLRNVKFEAVRAAMRPPAECGSCDIAALTSAYLMNTHQYVEPVYQMWKDGELKDGDPKGTAFVTARIADGAAELRDMVTWAWNASGKMVVGYPGVAAADVEAGKAGDAFDLLYGKH
jgi:hypothetical protein